MAFSRGEVVLVSFPFTDNSTTKVRPAVIISNEDYNSSHQDIIITKITSLSSRTPDKFYYPLTDWKISGLPKPSSVKPVVTTLAQSRVLHTIGSLTPNDLAGGDALLRATPF